MYIDTHAHLYLDKFKEDIDEVINRALDLDIRKIYLPNIDSSTTEDMNQLSKKFPEVCFPMIGLHPCSVKENYKEELEHIDEELQGKIYYGIGETGIDLYWDKTFKAEQIKAFEYQIDLARSSNLPIIIHSRESLDLTIDIITQNQDGKLRGIFHCFNGTIEQTRKISDINFLMGLGGVITYKNAKLDGMLEYVSMDRVVLETDSPYLSPVPFRGKRNESSYLRKVAEKLSTVKGYDLEIIKEKTTHNADALFRIQ